MMSCADELDMFALVCVIVGDIRGCKVPKKFKFGLLTSDCVTKFILFWGVIEFPIKVDCSDEFQFIGVFIPLEFQFIGVFDIVCELSVGDAKNCDCIRPMSLNLYPFLVVE